MLPIVDELHALISMENHLPGRPRKTLILVMLIFAWLFMNVRALEVIILNIFTRTLEKKKLIRDS